MESNNPQPSGNSLPSKPWEQAGVQSAAGPFRPSSPGSTSDVVEASGTAKPGEIVTANNNGPANLNSLGRPVPSRPWEQNYGNNLGGFNSGINYNTSYGTGLYGSGGGYGGSYGGGLYGNNMYRGYGGGQYGGSGYGGMYGGYGGPMSSYGMGMGMGVGMGGPYGDPDPNGPFGGPMSPPGFWISFLRVMQGVVTFFGRISMLVDQNTQAFHMFMSALLQLFDRTGMLYGELARFVLRLLGIKTKAKKIHPREHGALPGAHHGQNYIEGPKAASASWDTVWGGDK